MGSFDSLIDASASDPAFASLVADGAANIASPMEAALTAIAAGGAQIVTYLGTQYAGVVEAPSAKETASVAEGIGIDVANADVRVAILPCAQFSAADYPAEGSELMLTEGAATTTYTVLVRTVRQLADTDLAVRLLIYRTPPSGSSTAAPAGETGAGLPKVYVPPVNAY